MTLMDNLTEAKSNLAEVKAAVESGEMGADELSAAIDGVKAAQAEAPAYVPAEPRVLEKIVEKVVEKKVPVEVVKEVKVPVSSSFTGTVLTMRLSTSTVTVLGSTLMTVPRLDWTVALSGSR